MKKISEIFGKELTVVNVGLESMAESVADQGVRAVHLDWTPPQEGIKRLRVTQSGVNINDANQQVVDKIKAALPVLVGMGIAKDVIPGMHDKMILHAGPPIEWERMCGPTRGAIMGALIYEGLAKDEKEAEVLASSGDIEYAPCHHHHSVGPMAGIVSPSMPVFIFENKNFGNFAYCTQNEGLGKGAAVRRDGRGSLRPAEMDGN